MTLKEQFNFNDKLENLQIRRGEVEESPTRWYEGENLIISIKHDITKSELISFIEEIDRKNFRGRSTNPRVWNLPEEFQTGYDYAFIVNSNSQYPVALMIINPEVLIQNKSTISMIEGPRKMR